MAGLTHVGTAYLTEWHGWRVVMFGLYEEVDDVIECVTAAGSRSLAITAATELLREVRGLPASAVTALPNAELIPNRIEIYIPEEATA